MRPGRDMQLCLLAAIVLLVSVEAAHARTTFLTDEVLVNTYTTNSQDELDVPRRASGELVVVWRSVLQDSEYSAVFGRWLDPLGIHHGPEFRSEGPGR